MGLFGKKKEEDLEDDDELTYDEEKQDRRLTRKFKDLNPENNKKRKEPPKPWGKKERMIVLLIFLGTVLVSAGLTLSSKGFSIVKFTDLSSKINNFNLGSFSILKEKTFEIRKK